MRGVFLGADSVVGGDVRVEGCTRLEGMFLSAIGDVLSASGVDAGVCGLVLATTKGNVDSLECLGVMARRVAREAGFVDEPVVISNACISGVSAIIAASRMIREGWFRHVVVAGGDVLSSFVEEGFRAFRSVSEGGCRPYDASRDGLTLGEGCGAVLLTAERELAVEPCVEVLGGSVTNDANHISGPSRSGDGLAAAIEVAMRGVSVEDVAFVNGHGTGTAYNDDMESRAFALAGVAGVPVNGLKSRFGHMLGAAGVVESIVCARGLREGVVWGTHGFERGGTPVALDVSARDRRSDKTFFVKTASGFGGCNAAVVFGLGDGGCDVGLDRGVREVERVSILPDGRPFGVMIRELFRALGSPDMKFFKMDDLSKLLYVAVGRVLAQSGDLPCSLPSDRYRLGIVLANRSASLDSDLKHQKAMERGEVSPAIFVYTLPNVAAGEACIRYGIRGENTFFIDDSPERAEDYARMLLRRGHLDAVVCGWCELLGEDFGAEVKLLSV